MKQCNSFNHAGKGDVYSIFLMDTGCINDKNRGKETVQIQVFQTYGEINQVTEFHVQHCMDSLGSRPNQPLLQAHSL